jgi:hypothetical protein
MQHTPGAQGNGATTLLRAELEQLRPRALYARAEAAGVPDVELDAAQVLAPPRDCHVTLRACSLFPLQWNEPT